MSRKIKILLFLIAVIATGFFSVRYYVYHGGKRDIQSEDTAFTIPSKNIIAEFTANETTANQKYNNKPVAITGVVTSVNGKSVFVDEAVNCEFLTADSALKVGQPVTVKGRVVGFDDTFGELKLDQCNLSTK